MSLGNREHEARWASAGLAWLAMVAISYGCEGPPGPPGPSGQAGEPDAALDAAFDAPPDVASDAADAGTSVPPSHVTTGPGVKLAVSAAGVDPSGVVTVTFTITDGAGVPLDYAGTYTDGPVTAKWVLSWLGAAGVDGGAPPSYTAYTTQVHSSVDGTKTAALPDSDVGGTLTEIGVGQGTYQYVFGTKLPGGFDGTRTHTLGVWATRVFGGLTYVANTLYDFVPSGGAVTVTRDIVTTQACNQCHNPLGFHEGDTARREASLCILCHAPPAVDVSNGNALDMPRMIHKIHRGRFLPSVLDGGTYALTEDQPGGDAGAATVATLDDHSDVWFPSPIQDCTVCHKGAQGSVWRSEPATRALCTSCHDATSFVYPPPAGMNLHPGGAQPDDTTCMSSQCHGASARYSLVNVHATPSTDPGAPVLALTINGVTGTQPGQSPVLHFSVTKNGAPLDISASGQPLPWLAALIAGPTTDYAQADPVLYPIEQGAAPATGLAQDGAVGSYAFTFPAPIPADATGSYAVGMEAYLTPSGANVLYKTPSAALNPVAYFAVTDATPVPRRTVVDRDKCNSCHDDLAAHGGTRKSPEYCVMCHTPNAVDDQNAPRFEVPATTVQSVSFKTLVHKVHRGDQLVQGYVVGGEPAPTPANPAGTPVDFGAVPFPGDLRACWACHSSTSYLPPLPDGLLPTVVQEVLACTDPAPDPGAYCVNRVVQSKSLLEPLGAACTACHDSSSAVAHAQANTAPDGTESCAVCHGAGQPWDVQTVHVLPP